MQCNFFPADMTTMCHDWNLYNKCILLYYLQIILEYLLTNKWKFTRFFTQGVFLFSNKPINSKINSKILTIQRKNIAYGTLVQRLLKNVFAFCCMLCKSYVDQMNSNGSWFSIWDVAIISPIFETSSTLIRDSLCPLF